MRRGHLVQRFTPSRILDILETENMWMSSDELEVQFVDRFGIGNRTGINRSLQRLIDDDRVLFRVVHCHNPEMMSNFFIPHLEVKFRDDKERER